MKAAEYKAIKNISIVDLVFECAANLLTGDGCFTPDTPQYKALMGFAATMDSILDAQPFFDLKKKVLKGYSLWEILEPMMFNNYIPDGDNDFDFTVLPQQKYDVKKYKTHAGAWTMFCLWLLLIVCSPFAILAALIGFPIMCLKKRNNKKPQKKELPVKY